MSQEDSQQINEMLDIVRAGIRRFYDEGHYKWTKRSFEDFFDGKIPLSNPQVQSKLKEWEKNGAIRVVGKEDCYIEVLRRVE